MSKQRDWKKVGEIVEKIKEHGYNYIKGAKEFGISIEVLYEYNRRFKNNSDVSGTSGENKELYSHGRKTDQNIPDKEEKSTTNQSSVSRSDLTEDIQEIIISYRKKYPDHGYKRIEDHLKSCYFVVVSRKKIRELLKSKNLHISQDSSFDKEKSCKGTRRFEAPCPGDLYQMDVTYVYIKDIPVLYLVVIIDDYSRFCVGSKLYHDQRGITMINALHKSIERFGKPRSLLTDQGSGFYSWSNQQTIFQNYLDDMQIEHIVADPHSPQTLGKVERLNQTIKKELLSKQRFSSIDEARNGINNFIRTYNYFRPHQGIDGKSPSDRFYGIVEEVKRIESSMTSKSLDFSNGYLIFKDHEKNVSIINSHKGLQVFLNGVLMRGKQEDENGIGN